MEGICLGKRQTDQNLNNFFVSSHTSKARQTVTDTKDSPSVKPSFIFILLNQRVFQNPVLVLFLVDCNRPAKQAWPSSRTKYSFWRKKKNFTNQIQDLCQPRH